MTTATILPEFDRPPLSEVAISVQFESLSDFGMVHAGGLWQIFRDKFPIVEYQPALQPSFELFGLEGGQPNQVGFEILRTQPLPRIWFRNAENSKLIQFQVDKIALNWQKTNNSFDYPRYSSLREEFILIFNKILDYLETEKIRHLKVNQCELTYVNTINVTSSEKLLLKCFQKTELSSVGSLESVALNLRYKIEDANGAPVGRLIVHSTQGADINGNPISQLTLTGRGPPSLPNFTSALDFIDRAHSAIVTAFADLTLVELHKEWERRA